MSSVGRTASNRRAGWTRRARARRRLQPRARVVESLRRRVCRRRLVVRASSRPCAAASAGAVSSRASSRPYAAASVGGSRGGRRRPGRERPTSRQPWWSASPWWPAALAHVPVQASPARDPAGAVTPSDTERKLRRPPLFRPPRAAPSNPPCSGHLASIPPATSYPATSALFPNYQSGCSLPAASFRWRPEPPWLSQGPPP